MANFIKNLWKKEWFRTTSAIFGALVALFLVVTLFLNLITRHNRELSVPDFTNMPLQEAKKIARKAHLRLDVTDSVYIKRLGRGYISRQNPLPGSMVKKNRRILLTINSVNPKMVEMPSLIGFSLRQAKAELISKGLSVGSLIYVDDMATNNVLAQRYDGYYIQAGTVIECETPIDLVLGMSPLDCVTYVPDVRGYKYLTARDVLLDHSLNLQKAYFDKSVENYSDSLDAVVYKQSPYPSDSDRYTLGSSVILYLSKDQNKIGNSNEAQ